MNAQIELIPGTNRDLELSQYFTPPELAQRVVEWSKPTYPRSGAMGQAIIDRPWRVLEPSAGNGALVRPLVAAGAEVHAIEIDERYRSDLRRELGSWGNLFVCDFLERFSSDNRAYDLCVMNSPYHDDGEMKFALHALNFAPRVVGIFRADVFYSVTRGERMWSQIRPTRVAFCMRRPWKGAETDYCVLELVKRDARGPVTCTMEWWP